MEDEDMDFGYKVEDLEECIPEREEVAERRKLPLWVYFVLYFALGWFLMYYYSYYHFTLEEADYLMSINDLQSKVNALGTEISICHNTLGVENAFRLHEINITAECWDDLELCQYNNAVILGYNITKPGIIRELERDKKDFKELSDRYHELEKRLGIEK